MRWIRPLVPPFIADAIEATTKPLWGARQTIEETEEVHYSMRRTRKVTTDMEDIAGEPVTGGSGPRRASAVRPDDRDHGYGRLDAGAEHASPAMTRGQGRAELTKGGTRELGGHRGPRELPPGR